MTTAANERGGELALFPTCEGVVRYNQPSMHRVHSVPTSRVGAGKGGGGVAVG